MITEATLKRVGGDRLNNVIPFSYREIDGDYLVVSDTGRYGFLTPGQFRELIEKGPREGTELYDLLEERKMILTPRNSDHVADDKYRQLVTVARRTSLHILVVTGRCNLKCIYCQAAASSVKEKSLDMTPVTARDVIKTMFMAPVQTITLEFQGGEPLLNWKTVQFAIEFARELEKQSDKKVLVSLVSNFTLMDREKAEYLARQRVNLCMSLDGPAHVHNKNRGANHEEIVEKYKMAKEVFSDIDPNLRPSLLPTITKHSLPYAREIVNQFLDLEFNSIFLRPLTTLGHSVGHWQEAGVSPDEFLAFYKEVMDYIITLNKQGIFFFETQSVFMLNKILERKAYAYVDLCSPCGATRGQMAYNYDGRIYTCDEARMLGHAGDKSFCIGEAGKCTYEDLLNHPVSQTMTAATILDSLPGCSICVYRPYCGVCPIVHYSETGNIFTNIYNDRRHKILEGTFDTLFRYLKDPEVEGIFRSWVATQPDMV